MNEYFPVLLIPILIVIFMQMILHGKRGSKRHYDYIKKDFFLSRAEREFFNVLMLAVGNQYYVFPQVHLSTIIDHKIKGQYWNAAFRHINEKSVDFVLCDKNYIKPIIAIELDDYTHERDDRKERDGIVENILKDAGLPLLRIKNQGNFEKEKIRQSIVEFIPLENHTT
jgi:very-short-patch-repair endonuclease